MNPNEMLECVRENASVLATVGLGGVIFLCRENLGKLFGRWGEGFMDSIEKQIAADQE